MCHVGWYNWYSTIQKLTTESCIGLLKVKVKNSVLRSLFKLLNTSVNLSLITVSACYFNFFFLLDSLFHGKIKYIII